MYMFCSWCFVFFCREYLKEKKKKRRVLKLKDINIGAKEISGRELVLHWRSSLYARSKTVTYYLMALASVDICLSISVS